MDNTLIQVGLPVVALVVSLTAFLWEFVVIRRKQIGYRVQMDTPVTGEIPSPLPLTEARVASGSVAGTVITGKSVNGVGGHPNDLSIVLIRIENNGTTTIDKNDYATPDGDVGLHLQTPGRRVVAMAVTEFSDPVVGEHLMPGRGIGVPEDKDDVIDLPKVQLNRGDHYKVLAVLENIQSNRNPENSVDPVLHGKLKGGRIVETRSRTGVSRRVLGFLAFLMVVIVVQLVISLIPPPPQPRIGCASGALTVAGSSAFQPVLEEAAAAYRKDCPAANFSFTFEGSERGLDRAQAAGPGFGMLTVSDGPKGDGYPDLLPRPLAMSVFAVLVPRSLGVENLAAEQIRDLYEGRITNWNQIGGPNQPVRLINRILGSGTRATLQQRLLGGDQPVPARIGCRALMATDPPGLQVCEAAVTQDMLADVAEIHGAVGYSEVADAAQASGLVAVTIDGTRPTREGVTAQGYPFWGVEYAYSNGELRYDSLAAAFLRYLTDGAGKDIIRQHGNTPCTDVSDPARCGPNR